VRRSREGGASGDEEAHGGNRGAAGRIGPAVDRGGRGGPHAGAGGLGDRALGVVSGACLGILALLPWAAGMVLPWLTIPALALLALLAVLAVGASRPQRAAI
jgi:hypothetical protein